LASGVIVTVAYANVEAWIALALPGTLENWAFLAAAVFFIPLAAVIVGLVLCGLLFVVRPPAMEAERATSSPGPSPSPPAPVVEKKGKSRTPKA